MMNSKIINAMLTTAKDLKLNALNVGLVEPAKPEANPKKSHMCKLGDAPKTNKMLKNKKSRKDLA